jgi:hypothetical protein
MATGVAEFKRLGVGGVSPVGVRVNADNLLAGNLAIKFLVALLVLDEKARAFGNVLECDNFFADSGIKTHGTATKAPGR